MDVGKVTDDAKSQENCAQEITSVVGNDMTEYSEMRRHGS